MIVKVLHLEPTDSCQAACPQCARETDQAFDKNDQNHLTVDQIKELFTEQQIKQLDKMYMCGDYGDPAAGKHTLEILKYFRSVNPNITLGMNTNGGLRDGKWWQELAGIMSGEKDYVIFSIDGLEDTNHIYRVNVNWSKVIDNVNTFITAGGPAHWDMIVFEHNQHQVDLCEQQAKDLGFAWFRAKVSRRHSFIPVTFLHPPKGWANPTVSEGNISCQALNEQSMYVSAEGVQYPCCWLGVTDYTLDKFDAVQESWKSSPVQLCKDTCTKSDQDTSFTNQWQREVEFQF
jgi:MoaA/NifB/PqqE/SkfB family radical SAM enzyme